MPLSNAASSARAHHSASPRAPSLERRWRSLILRPIYDTYERHLRSQVCAGPLPRHIGLILDGNRRYARRHRLTKPAEIYGVGADKLDDLLEWCVELGIPAITLWVFSTDNLSRPAVEICGILAAIERKMTLLAEDPEIHRRKVRVCAMGRLDSLPASTRDAVRAAQAATSDYEGMRLTIAAAYGGREEITDAVQAFLRAHQRQGTTLAEIIESVTPQAIGQYLYAPDLPDPELIIRTSGEIRLSGFLLWQSAYSEFYFTDVFWPAFRRIDLLRAIRDFQRRRRRFGQ